MYIDSHGKARSMRLDQVKCLRGHQIKILCNRNNTENIEAPVNGHRATGMVEKLIRTIKDTLAVLKEKKLANNYLLFTNCEYVNRKNRRFCPSKHTLLGILLPCLT